MFLLASTPARAAPPSSTHLDPAQPQKGNRPGRNDRAGVAFMLMNRGEPQSIVWIELVPFFRLRAML